jgi:hypothetical protein
MLTLAQVRQAFAHALGALPGITGYAVPPSTMLPGDAWPLLASLERDGGFAFVAEWRVLVICGGSALDAITFMDAHLPALTSAIEPVAYVAAVTPVAISTPAGDLHGVELRARTEGI